MPEGVFADDGQLRVGRLPGLPAHLRPRRERHPHRAGLPRRHLRVPRRCAARGRDLRRADRLARPRRAVGLSDAEHFAGDRPGHRRRARATTGIEARILIAASATSASRRPRSRPPPRRRPPSLRRRLQPGRRRGRLPARAVRARLRDRGAAGPRLHRPRRRARGRRVGARGARRCRSRASPTACGRSRIRRWWRSSPTAGIVLEVCPTSNVALGLYPSYEAHPLGALRDAGVRVTLGSDDPPYFGCRSAASTPWRASASASMRSELREITRTAVGGGFRGGCGQARPCSARLDCPGRSRQPLGSPPPQDLSLLEETQCQCAVSPPSYLVGLRAGVGRRSPLAAAATTARAPAFEQRHAAPRRRRRRSRSASSPTSAASTTASFNQLANQGLEQAKSELGVDGRVLTSKSNADYVPNLSTLAQQKYDLVIGVGFLMADAMDTVAKKFPDTKFAIIDFAADGPQGQADERRGPAVQGAGGRLPRRLPGRPVRQGQGRQAGRLARSAARRSRRSTTTSPATRPAPRRPTRTSRRSTATRRTSSTRRSARRSRSTRSPRARRSSSRSPASAASARSTRPRRRASRASASTPTRATSAPTS